VYAVSGFIQSNQFVDEPDAFIGHSARERGVLVAAMGEEKRCAEFALGAFAESHVELDLADAPIPVVLGSRIERLRTQALLEPKLG